MSRATVDYCSGINSTLIPARFDRVHGPPRQTRLVASADVASHLDSLEINTVGLPSERLGRRRPSLVSKAAR